MSRFTHIRALGEFLLIGAMMSCERGAGADGTAPSVVVELASGLASHFESWSYEIDTESVGARSDGLAGFGVYLTFELTLADASAGYWPSVECLFILDTGYQFVMEPRPQGTIPTSDVSRYLSIARSQGGREILESVRHANYNEDERLRTQVDSAERRGRLTALLPSYHIQHLRSILCAVAAGQ